MMSARKVVAVVLVAVAVAGTTLADDQGEAPPQQSAAQPTAATPADDAPTTATDAADAADAADDNAPPSADDAQPIEVLGLDDDGILRLKTEEPRLRGRLVVAESRGEALSGVTVEVIELRTATGSPLTLAIEPASFDLAPWATRHVDLETDVPAEEVYDGWLQLRWAGDPPPKPLRVPVSIAREPRAAPTVALVVPASLRETVGDGFVTVPLELRETRGRGTETHEPRLAKPTLSYIESDGEAEVDVVPAHVELRRRECAAETPNGAVSDRPIELASLQRRCYDLTLGRLLAAGIYTVDLEVPVADGDARVAPSMKIFVRHTFFVALLAILVGVLASYSLRRWLQVDRPALLAERQLAELRHRHVRRFGADDEVWALLEREIDSLVLELRITPGADLIDRIETVERQIDAYRQVRRLLDRDVDGLVWDLGERPAIRGEIDALRTAIAVPSVGELEELGRAASEIEQKITASNRAFLEQEIDELAKRVAADLEFIGGAPAAGTPVAERARPILERAAALLQKARDELDGRLAAARSRYREATKLYGEVRAAVEAERRRAGQAVVEGREATAATELGAALDPLVVRRSVADILAEVRRRDRWALLISVGVAVLLGLKALWLPDATWGSFADYITALLWGFGLHQITGLGVAAGPLGLGAASGEGGDRAAGGKADAGETDGDGDATAKAAAER